MDSSNFPFEGTALIGEERWREAITSLCPPFENLQTNKERVKRRLTENLKRALTTCLEKGNAGILLSGGVDSTLLSLLAKKEGADFTCYAVGLEGSKDIEWAQRASSEHTLPLVYKTLTLQELEVVTKEVIRLLETTDIVKVGVGVVTYTAGKLARAQGKDTLLTGLGSEELFAGYQRHKDALQDGGFEAVHKECMKGLGDCYARDITRDDTIARSLNLSIRFPFLLPDVIKEAMSLHPMCKLDNTGEKLVIREIAEESGVQKDIAWRKKTAAQYGSSVVKGLGKLASQKGFSSKKEYLASLR